LAQNGPISHVSGHILLISNLLKVPFLRNIAILTELRLIQFKISLTMEQFSKVIQKNVLQN